MQRVCHLIDYINITSVVEESTFNERSKHRVVRCRYTCCSIVVGLPKCAFDDLADSPNTYVRCPTTVGQLCILRTNQLACTVYLNRPLDDSELTSDIHV